MDILGLLNGFVSLAVTIISGVKTVIRHSTNKYKSYSGPDLCEKVKEIKKSAEMAYIWIMKQDPPYVIPDELLREILSLCEKLIKIGVNPAPNVSNMIQNEMDDSFERQFYLLLVMIRIFNKYGLNPQQAYIGSSGTKYIGS